MQIVSSKLFFWEKQEKYHIVPNNCTYPYKHTVKHFVVFRLQPCIFCICFLINAYVVGTKVEAIQMSTNKICFYKEQEKRIIALWTGFLK